MPTLIVVQVTDDLIVEKGRVFVIDGDVLTVMGDAQKIKVNVLNATSEGPTTSKRGKKKMRAKPGHGPVPKHVGGTVASQIATVMLNQPSMTAHDVVKRTGLKENSVTARMSIMARCGMLAAEDREGSAALYTLTAKGKRLLWKDGGHAEA